MTKQAILALADGSIFRGEAIGADGQTVGEVVFNTAMTGYQEILTDPSYAQQIVTLTYPHVGNTGTTPEDAESDRVWSAGLVIRDLPLVASNWRNTMSLADYLKTNNVVAIAGIDTRRLTRILREKGAQNGCIMAGDNISEEAAIAAARGFPGLKGMDLAKVVSTEKAYEWRSSVWNLATDSHPTIEASELPYHVVAYDYGVKWNILRMLVERGCRVTVLPGTATAAKLAALNPDGLMLSNGPGDPAENVEIIANIREMLDTGIPTFGICLGHQLTALAAGAKTCKLKYGHRGANQPVSHVGKGRTFITSQNHGYAVEAETLPAEVGKMSYFNANDGTCEGVDYFKWNCFTVQFHPEANGGPKDTEFLFDEFVSRMLAAKGVIDNA